MSCCSMKLRAHSMSESESHWHMAIVNLPSCLGLEARERKVHALDTQHRDREGIVSWISGSREVFESLARVDRLLGHMVDWRDGEHPCDLVECLAQRVVSCRLQGSGIEIVEPWLACRLGSRTPNSR